MTTEKEGPGRGFRLLDGDPEAICAAVLARHQRILLLGAPGSGKSTLAAALARAWAGRDRPCGCIVADPGSPAFGPPGAVSLAAWERDAWQVIRSEALCTLDAGRFRLPLAMAVRRLAGAAPPAPLLLDMPGLTRGVAAAELLPALAEAVAVDAVLAISRGGGDVPLRDELCALGVAVFVVPAAAAAVAPGRRLRARRRTARWDAWLDGGAVHDLDLTALAVVGTPPPRQADAWAGRQIALLRAGRTVTMGEVLALTGHRLRVRLPGPCPRSEALLVRDAARDAEGLLRTVRPFAAEPSLWQAPSSQAGAEEGGPRLVTRVGSHTAQLLNGICGDPLLHLRLVHQRRSLFFDLGEGGRLPVRLAHQATDVFISHAHLDHIAGFVALLRARVGEFPPCRLYGPPGLARHIQGFLQAVLWDRVAERAPCFEVAELHGQHLRCFRLLAGQGEAAYVGERPAADGVLLDEEAFRVRAVTLDHHTPVLAFAFEPACQIQVRKDRLRARGWAPGPWLGELKRRLLADEGDAVISLPDGGRALAAELGAALTLKAPGKRLVYATDFADTVENRRCLVDLARHAHTLFCEAAFLEADAPLAARTGHLTARACGEIATAARVARLVPFHFSRRYKVGELGRLYAEVSAACSRVLMPPGIGRC